MKANELRLGNYIYCLDELSIVDIESLEMINDKFGWWYPIPLTEEWLKKFGFEENSYSWTKLQKLKHVGFATVKIVKQGKNRLIYNGLNIKHVHQLQNLYFALTGEELTILDR